MKSLLTRMAKARTRSRAELKERAAQWASAQAEALGLRDRGLPSPRSLLARCRPAVATAGVDALLDSLLLGVRAETLPMFEAEAETHDWMRGPGTPLRNDVIARAEAIMRGEYHLLGFPLVKGDPLPRWDEDPVMQVRAPDRHWSRVRYLDPRVVGDHKIVWELSRHQYIVTLAQAWWLTHDRRYVDRAVALLDDWMKRNPPKRGINWASSLEVAYRSIAWIWVLRLLRKAPELDRAVVLRLVTVLEMAGRHLERYLSTWFSANTHLTGEALGLLYLGTHLPELKSAERWSRLGWNILMEQLPRHVRPDGTYFEQSTWYHRYTLEIYLHARLHGARFPLAERQAMDDAIGRLALALRWVSRPDGSIPVLGDDDGGRLLSFGGASAYDARSSLALAAAHLSRGDLLDPQTDVSDVAWMLGAVGVTDLARIPAVPPTERGRAFPDGGLYVMRSGWGPADSVVVVDCGPHGADNGGHAHADALAFDLSVGGQSVFVDPGTVSYTARPADRQAMRSSQVHNTITLDEQSSALPAGPFSWATQAEGHLGLWVTGDGMSYFRGSHDGYRRLEHAARHQREILDTGCGWWVVRDLVSSAREHWGAATFQGAAGLELAVAETGLRVTRGSQAVAQVIASGRGVWAVSDGVASRMYGARSPAPCGRYHFRADGRNAVNFIIVREDDQARQVTHGREGARGWVRVTDAAGSHLAVFGPGPEMEGLESDAATAWLWRDLRGAPLALFAVGGTAVAVDGVTVPLGGAEAVRLRYVHGAWTRVSLLCHPERAGA